MVELTAGVVFAFDALLILLVDIWSSHLKNLLVKIIIKIYE